MTMAPPVTIIVTETHFACQGVEGTLGHPRVWLRIVPEVGHVDCGYCGAHYILDETAKAGAH